MKIPGQKFETRFLERSRPMPMPITLMTLMLLRMTQLKITSQLLGKKKLTFVFFTTPGNTQMKTQITIKRTVNYQVNLISLKGKEYILIPNFILSHKSHGS